MDVQVKSEQQSPRPSDDNTRDATPRSDSTPRSETKQKSRKNDAAGDSSKRRCVSTACIACRKRKSKCDGNIPACAACSSVYGTECIYDPNSDHRRKGVYKKDIDSLKTRNSTLQTLIHAILNSPEEQVPDLVRQIRVCESLDKVAESIIAKEKGELDTDLEEDTFPPAGEEDDSPTFESQLSSKIGSLRLDDGSLRYFGGTSNLAFLGSDEAATMHEEYEQHENPTTSWTNVTSDPDLIAHLLNHYFTWHYTFFTILPKALFYKHFLKGKPSARSRKTSDYCTPLLVNTMLSLGCHFTSNPAAREDPDDSSTAGDHFFKEAKRLLYEEDELSRPSLATVQALALMSVREAGCARESNGWGYSGMAFRMSCDLGLSFQTSSGYMLGRAHSPDEAEEDARRVTFWGCFLVDKCWSNYLGRLPLFQLSANVTVPMFDVFPQEEADTWSPYSDSGFSQAHAQPSRVRAVALQISALSAISSDLIKHFYGPPNVEKPVGKQAELKRLSEIHGRLEEWRRNLPKELEPKEGILSSVIVMHMFFQLLYIHLFRPFLKYNQSTSPLPAHVSPRKICTQAAGMISKLLRLYKRSHGLRQIVNFAVYIAHSACIIHLLNLPEKTAKRDISHGVKHLEEIAEGWLAARRTLSVLSLQARKWKVELPEEATIVLARTDAKFGSMGASPKSPGSIDGNSPPMHSRMAQQMAMAQQHSAWQQQANFDASDGMMFDTDDLPQVGGMGPPPGNYSSPGQYTNHSGSSYQHVSTRPDLNLDSTLSSSRLQQPQPLPIPNSSTSISSSTTNPKRHYSTTQAQPQSLAQTQTPSHLHQTQSQTPLQTTPLPRPLKTPRHNPTPSSSDLFGGVEALLREGQDWWMRDQNLASGFGNWRNSVTASNNTSNGNITATGMAGLDWAGQAQQAQGQGRGPSGRQPSWSLQGAAAPTAEEASGNRRSSIGGFLDGPGTGGFGGAGAGAGLNGGIAGGGAGLHSGVGVGVGGVAGGLNGNGGISGYGFGHLTNQYDENEWYQ